MISKESSLLKTRLAFIIPSVVTIAAFVMSIFLYFLPRIQDINTGQKKESIQQLVQLPLQVCRWYEQEAAAKEISEETAQENAAAVIRSMRYGFDGKDYFWIVNMEPTLIMHPYRTDLEGENVANYKDDNGTLVFMEMIDVVEAQSEGFVTYSWQKRDDAEKIGHKLSFVSVFEPWGWIVGTGIYLGEVEQEIAAVTRSMMLVSSGVAIFIALLLFLMIREGISVQKGKTKVTSELAESEHRYRRLVEAMHEGMVGQDTNGCFNLVNRQFCSMTGFSADELIGKKVIDFLEGENLDIFRTEMEKRKTGKESVYTMEWKTKSGQRLVSLVSPRIVYDAAGELNGSFAVVTDITDLKKAEDELRNLLQEKTVLLKEVHHRVKNNLQLISSLFSLQSLNIKDVNVRNMLFDSQARIQTMSRVHEQLYQSDNFRYMSMSDFLEQLVLDVKSVYQEVDEEQIRFITDVENISLSVEQAIPCGLIMNELVSNSVKHAFSVEGNVQGRKKVSLFLREEGNRIVFGVEDNGKGLPEGFSIEGQSSLGMELISILTEQLSGKLSLGMSREKTGCRIEVYIPYDREKESRLYVV